MQGALRQRAGRDPEQCQDELRAQYQCMLERGEYECVDGLARARFREFARTKGLTARRAPVPSACPGPSPASDKVPFFRFRLVSQIETDTVVAKVRSMLQFSERSRRHAMRIFLYLLLIAVAIAACCYAGDDDDGGASGVGAGREGSSAGATSAGDCTDQEPTSGFPTNDLDYDDQALFAEPGQDIGGVVSFSVCVPSGTSYSIGLLEGPISPSPWYGNEIATDTLRRSAKTLRYRIRDVSPGECTVFVVVNLDGDSEAGPGDLGGYAGGTVEEPIQTAEDSPRATVVPGSQTEISFGIGPI